VPGSQPQTPQQRDQFKADLYCFLVEQMKVALDKIFSFVHGKPLHPDLTEQRGLFKEERTR